MTTTTSRTAGIERLRRVNGASRRWCPQRVPEYAKALAGYQQSDNAEILGAVDQFLHCAATEPR